MPRKRPLGAAVLVALLGATCSSASGGSTSPTPPDSGPTTSAAAAPSTSSNSASPSSTSQPAPTDFCRQGDFRVDENRAVIVGPDGEDFLPAGINLTAGEYRDGSFWEKTSVTDLTAADVGVMVDVWRFNTIRLNIDSAQTPDVWTSAELDRVISLLVDAGVVAMVENHPYGTGQDPTPEQIDETARGFAALAERWRDNACVWFNPFNEPGGQRGESVYDINSSDVTGDDAWVRWHTPVIDAIRAVAPDAVVVLDDTHFGQGRAGSDYGPDESAILTYGPELNRQYDNLVFSVHLYDRWGGERDDIAAFFAQAADEGLAVLVGEVGGHPTEGPWFTRGYWPSAEALFELRPPGVGILLWHGRTAYTSGMSVARDHGQRVAVWEVTDRADTEASGRLLWDWTH